MMLDLATKITLEKPHWVDEWMATYLFWCIEGTWNRCCCLNENDVVSVGRDARNDVVVRDCDCSRQHFELRKDKVDWILRDLQSLNGTFVDGNRLVGETAVRLNSIIRIGQTEFLLSDSLENEDEPNNESESSPGTVSQLLVGLQQFQADDEKDQAQQELVKAYFHKLVRLAKHRLRHLQNAVEDEEDAALSALDSFFRAVDDGRFPKLENREDLWRLLVTITVRKVRRQLERRLSAKRGAGASTDEGAIDLGSGNYASIEEFVEDKQQQQLELELMETLEHCLSILKDPALRTIAERKLEGRTSAEIGATLNLSKRTVERKLTIIRASWENSGMLD